MKERLFFVFLGGIPEMIRHLIRKLAYGILGRLTIDDLVKRGMKVGSNCVFQDDLFIDDSHCWHITIGSNVGFAPGVKVLAHDGCMKKYLGYTRIGKVVIDDNVFIGAGSIVMPNVRIGANSIIGAGSVVDRDIPPNVVATGNPIRIVKDLETFLNGHREKMKKYPCFGFEYTLGGRVDDVKKEEMNRLMVEGQGYVE
jgi:maltose O-acetyltransferase